MLDDVRASLSVPGGLAEFPKPMLPAVAGLVVVTALRARKAATRAFAGIVALALAAVLGLAAVLLLSGRLGGTWGHYPQKYAWIATALLLVIALPQVVCAVAQLRVARLRQLLYVALTLTLAVSLGFGSWWAPGRLNLLSGSLPYYLLVEDGLPDDGQSPDAVADAVIARVDLPRLTIPWESRLANDYRAAFWLIQLEREQLIPLGDDQATDTLWRLANFHDSPADLCTLASVVPKGLTVQTANATLPGKIEELCPTADLVVELEPASG